MLALTCVFVLGAGTLWALSSKGFHDRRPSLVAPRDWWRPDSVGLAIDSAVEGGIAAVDSSGVVDSVLALAGERTGDCIPYDPQHYEIASTQHTGPVSISNRSKRSILVTFYIPNGDGWSTIQRRVVPGRTTFLTTTSGERAIARANWGVKVDAYCVEPLDHVAEWTAEHYTVTWRGAEEGTTH
jgi:hypothetical protein